MLVLYSYASWLVISSCDLPNYLLVPGGVGFQPLLSCSLVIHHYCVVISYSKPLPVATKSLGQGDISAYEVPDVDLATIVSTDGARDELQTWGVSNKSAPAQSCRRSNSTGVPVAGGSNPTTRVKCLG